jgi:putative ABC transport system permease protein
LATSTYENSLIDTQRRSERDPGLWYKVSTAAMLAFDSIRVHKLRSFLTLLGVIIGVASVVLVGAAINGLGAYAESTTAKAFGSDSYLVAQIASVGRLSQRQVAEKRRYNKRIRPEDVAYLDASTGDEIIYSPYEQRTEDVKAENQTYEAANVLGTDSTLPEIRDIPVEDGRFYSATEVKLHRPVAVIGQDIRSTLFPNTSPLGHTIRIYGTEFTIIGLLERQGSSFGQNLDNPVYIPFTVYNELYGSRGGAAVFGKARPGSGLDLNAALDKTRAALRVRFHTKPGRDDNFDVLTPDSIRSFVGQILGVIAVIIVPVTSISLVVGGIVIMNIMLVSVTERTQEIGIRKSLGARQSDIMLQFLTESVILSLTGGAMGLLLAAVLAQVISHVAGTMLQISVPYVILSIFVSTAVGVISGWYPARRAARLDPVVALRSE